jgi:hypothetical protein
MTPAEHVESGHHGETKQRLRELIMEGLASGPGQLATPELFAEIRDRAMALPL